MAREEYTDAQRTEFVALAQEIGIRKARIELGFPRSHSAGLAWCRSAGVETNAQQLLDNVRKYHIFYELEDMQAKVEELVERIGEDLYDNDSLTPEDKLKLSNAMDKAVKNWLLLKGKATSITESNQKDAMDKGIYDLIMAEKAKNKIEEVEESSDIKND